VATEFRERRVGVLLHIVRKIDGVQTIDADEQHVLDAVERPFAVGLRRERGPNERRGKCYLM
jgi:hypothetical protein